MTVATVDLVRTPTQTGVWHLVKDDEQTVCALATDETWLTERDFDPHVVQFRGKRVCARCRGTARYFTGRRQ